MWDLYKLSELIGIIAAFNAVTIFAVKRLMENQWRAFAQQVHEVKACDVRQDANVQTVREELAAFKLEATRSFIHREDALVYFGRFEQKIDAIWTHLMHMQGE